MKTKISTRRERERERERVLAKSMLKLCFKDIIVFKLRQDFSQERNYLNSFIYIYILLNVNFENLKIYDLL